MTNQTHLCSNLAVSSSAPAGVRQTFRKLPLAVAIALTLTAGWSSPQAQAEPGDHWVDGRVLVRFRAGLPQSDQDKLLQAHGGRALGRIQSIDVHVVEVPSQAEDAVVRALLNNPHVKFAEKDMLVEPADVTPADPSFASEWHLSKIGAPTAWSTTMGSGITIAILDTGVDSTHPDLVGQMVSGWNVYDNNAITSDVYGHGTWVAGTAAAATNNGIGVASVAGQARIMPVRISDPSGYATWSAVAQGIAWAADHNAKVANISYDNMSGSSTVQNAAQYMRNKGGVVVVAAGNNGLENFAASDTMLSVSSTGKTDALSSFSSYGPYVDLAAPGEYILTTNPGGGYVTVQGTSFASPIVAGVAAMIMSANGALSPNQIDSILKSTAVDLGTAGWDQYYGTGRVNAAAAVTQAVNTFASDTQPPTVSIAAPTGGKVSGLVTVSVNAADNTGVGRVELFANGVKVGEDIAAPFDFSWATTTIPDGTVTLYANAYDTAGNPGQSQSVSVTVDNVPDPVDTIPPTVKITNPVNGAKVSGANVSINVSASDNVAIKTTTCAVDGQTLGISSSSSLKCSWNIKKAAAGAHAISATAEDTAGNKSTTSIQVTK